MPRTKAKSDRQRCNGVASPGEVLTLAEAAAYLRVAEKDILRLVQEQGLPGRSVGDDWRFLKASVQEWLGTAASTDPSRFWQAHFGALRDDPFLDEMLKGIYQRRGRPEMELSGSG